VNEVDLKPGYDPEKKEPAIDIAGLCLPLKPQKERSFEVDTSVSTLLEVFRMCSFILMSYLPAMDRKPVQPGIIDFLSENFKGSHCRYQEH